jgi:D-erythronate 2-dehydrogenase
MRVVVIGGAGFLGQKLLRALLAQGHILIEGEKRPLEKLLVFDLAPATLPTDERLELVTGDIGDKRLLAKVLEQAELIFHLAAVVSGEAEQHFELGMAVNLQATLSILETSRSLAAVPRLVFSSSIAVFGGDLPAVVEDDTAPIPQSSYGTQKAAAELFVNDYSRKGFIDGRVLRLPTIVVRPGKPNKATSTFASSIIREPLQGKLAICPVSADTRLWILSPRQAIQSFLHAAALPAAAFGKNRSITLPGLSLAVKDMVESLESLAGPEVSQRISWQPDPFIQGIVGSWPSCFRARRAQELGFQADPSMAQVIQAFIDDDLAS